MEMQSAESISWMIEAPLTPTADTACKQIWPLFQVLGIWSSEASGRYVTPLAPPPPVVSPATVGSINIATPEKLAMGSTLTHGSLPGIELFRRQKRLTCPRRRRRSIGTPNSTTASVSLAS